MSRVFSFSWMSCWLWGCAMLHLGSLVAQPIDPDDVGAAMMLLEQKREQLLQTTFPPDAHLYHQMMDLGMWEEAEELLAADSSTHDRILIAKARFAWLNNAFRRAALYLQDQKEPNNPEALLLSAQLEIEAWRLDAAEKICLGILDEHPQDEEAVLLLGRISLLKKNYPKARALAEQVQQWNPYNATAYLLQADAYFWLQEPDKAIDPLRRCLELAPLNADARFAYGYAIWRRVDATQLQQMAKQWEIALAVNPLHFMTHWHWGNGHTHLTYTDYADPLEDSIRSVLNTIHTSFDQIDPQLARDLVSAYPNSVIPEMIFGSYYYMKGISEFSRSAVPWDALNLSEQTFRAILQKKPNYGPAHNALAAIIKQKRFHYLDRFEELETQIEETEIQDSVNFHRVFPDMRRYSGSRVPKMIWQQLHTGVVYFPFLSRLGRTFVIPPLHEDLAIAMKDPYFRGGTTFDNRQWMDIRGVGTGATGIEYVERGAHLERNVTLHEYVHLFHIYLFTDEELRAVRTRYFYAMEHGLTLDYYSANNEFEYFAQTFPAYFIPVKVHPLNHKSLNTQQDLASQDPLMYAFIDSLVKKHQAYLAGDTLAMADTWAQTYIELAKAAQSPLLLEKSIQFLDTAYRWDSTYLPVHLAYAHTYLLEGQIEEAENWLALAQEMNPSFAPIYQHYAELVREQYLQGNMSEAEAIREQASYYRKAQSLEKDLYILAEINRDFRQTYLNFCRIPEAIEIAEAYAVNAPKISTDLRTHQLRASAFAQLLKGRMGYTEEVLDFFRQQTALRPQDYSLLAQYAELLILSDQSEQAIKLLKPAFELLSASKNPQAAIWQQLATASLAQSDSLSAKEILIQFLDAENELRYDTLEIIPLLVDFGYLDQANAMMAQQAPPSLPHSLANYHFAQGCLHQANNSTAKAIQAFQHGLSINPYLWPARLRLIELLIYRGETAKAAYLGQQGSVLPLPPGNIWEKRLAVILAKAKN
ncbi:MAG: tetratricopeptide repeat protein [Bacteroidota bacterium]